MEKNDNSQPNFPKVKKANRKTTPENIEMRILVSTSHAALIIGNRGSNIEKLRSDYNAFVAIPECAGPEQVLTIISKPANAFLVLEDVLCKLSEFNPFRQEDNGGVNRKKSNWVHVKLLVHRGQTASIIGLGGATVKKLRIHTGSSIKVYENCCPLSTDRVVLVNGRPDSCTSCVKRIMALLRETPKKGIECPYCPNNNCGEQQQDFREYGGYGHPAFPIGPLLVEFGQTGGVGGSGGEDGGSDGGVSGSSGANSGFSGGAGGFSGGAGGFGGGVSAFGGGFGGYGGSVGKKPDCQKRKRKGKGKRVNRFE